MRWIISRLGNSGVTYCQENPDSVEKQVADWVEEVCGLSWQDAGTGRTKKEFHLLSPVYGCPFDHSLVTSAPPNRFGALGAN